MDPSHSFSNVEVRRFVCTHAGCNKSFNRRDYLERHAANHLVVKPFYCHSCNRYFARGDLYENHLLTKLHVKRATGSSGGGPSSGDGMTSSASSVTSPPLRENSRRPRSPVGNGLTNQELLAPPLKRPTPSLFTASSGGLAPPQLSPVSSSYSQFSPALAPPLAPLPSTSSLLSTPSLSNSAPAPSNPSSSPSIHSPDSPSQPAISFAWMFDDRLDTDFANTRYDEVYSRYVNQYQLAADQYEATGGYKTDPPPITVDDAIAQRVMAVLDPIHEYHLSAATMAYYVELVFATVETVNTFLHRHTFYTRYASPQLLSSVIVLGMSLSDEPHIINLAKVLYMRAFEGVKVAMSRSEPSDAVSDPKKQFRDDISLLQAVCILMRFESHILGGENHDMHSMSTGKWLIERFLWVHMPKVTSLSSRGAGSASSVFSYGDIGSRGYHLLPNADPHAQWQEWAEYESCKRSAHFALYCDCVHTLGSRDAAQLSIFDIDTHMACPEALWTATCAEEFMAIVGPPRMVMNVPYLYVVKSMLRFPRVGEETTIPDGQYPWSLFSLSILLYGLLSIARAMTGSVNSPEEIVRKLNSTGADRSWAVEYYDRGIQGRLSRGFDIWTQYFEAATGNSQNQYPFRVFDNKFDNVNIIGQVPIRGGTTIFLDYILLILLHYHSAQLLMNEEVNKIAEIAIQLPVWVQRDPAPVESHIPADIYGFWTHLDDTKKLVSKACVFLVRITAGKRLLSRDRAENLLLGVVTYYSVITVWLYDLFRDKTDELERPIDGNIGGYDRSDDEKMIHNATSVLYRIWSETTGTPANGYSNDLTPIPAPVSSVIGLGAWLLRGINIGMAQTGGQILHSLHKRLYPHDSAGFDDGMYLL